MLRDVREVKDQLQHTHEQLRGKYPDLKDLTTGGRVWAMRDEAQLAFESMLENCQPDETWPVEARDAFNQSQERRQAIAAELATASGSKAQLMGQLEQELAAQRGAQEQARPELVEARGRVDRLDSLGEIAYYLEDIDQNPRTNLALNELGPRLDFLLYSSDEVQPRLDPNAVVAQARSQAQLPELEAWLDDISRANERIRRRHGLDEVEPAATFSEDDGHQAESIGETEDQGDGADLGPNLRLLTETDPEIEKLLDDEGEFSAERIPSSAGPEQQAWAELEIGWRTHSELRQRKASLERRIFYRNPRTSEARASRRRMYRARDRALEAPSKTQEVMKDAADNHEAMEGPREYLEMIEADAKRNYKDRIFPLLKEAAKGEDGRTAPELLKSLRVGIESLGARGEEAMLELLLPCVGSGRPKVEIAGELSQALETQDWYAAERRTTLDEMAALRQDIKPEILKLREVVESQQREEDLLLRAQKAKSDYEALELEIIEASPLFAEWDGLESEIAEAVRAIARTQEKIDQLASVTRNETVDPSLWRPPSSHSQFATRRYQHFYRQRAA